VAELLDSLLEDTGNWLSAVVDLLIVFGLVYVTLLLIRGTRTISMAIGLAVLIGLYLLSRAAGLTTTFMVLDQVMAVVAIFVLIIFQDDIRRALVRVGKFAWMSKARETQIVEEVIRAASTLAGRHIGALIVFERHASLDEFKFESGTVLDASVSKELLCAIFVPGAENPLHDGAAIISNYRIREAGSLLPLSANPGIDKTLGTRHRAALGITEETDAVSVVVSEERGTISLCFEGRITRNLDQAALRKALLGLFSSAKTKKRREAAKERETKRQSFPPPPLSGEAAEEDADRVGCEGEGERKP